jgi:glycosyltransferase involved in cell wall biosynthesis
MHIGIVAPCSSGPLADLLPTSGGLDIGWGGHLIATLVRALIARGHRISVVTLCPELKESRVLTGPQLAYYVYPTRLHRRMRDLYKVERSGLKEGISLAQPDLLHAHWTYEFALASFESGLPILITSHDNAFQQLWFMRDLYRLGRLYMQLQVIRKARFLTAVSPYLADSHRWLAKADIEVVPNPIAVPGRIENTGEHGSGPAKIATVLNGWGERKNPKAAIKAFHLLSHKLPDVAMFMYGDGFEEGGPAARWASNLGLSRNIHFCGFLPHHRLQMKLSEMTLLLHPALEEACPMALLEAMALGIPVIGGVNSGGVPWVLDEGRAGFLADVRDPENIAQSLRNCIEQPKDREQMARAAYNRVVNLFSPNSVAAQYEKIYEKVLSF